MPQRVIVETGHVALEPGAVISVPKARSGSLAGLADPVPVPDGLAPGLVPLGDVVLKLRAPIHRRKGETFSFLSGDLGPHLGDRISVLVGELPAFRKPSPAPSLPGESSHGIPPEALSTGALPPSDLADSELERLTAPEGKRKGKPAAPKF